MTLQADMCEHVGKQYPNIHFNAQVCLFLHVTHTVRLRRLCTVCVHANVLYALRYCVWRKVFVLLNMTPFFSFPALSLNIHQFCTFTKVSLTLLKQERSESASQQACY